MHKDVKMGESKTLLELYDRKNNAFDLVRFVLAVMVIYSHSYPLFYGPTNSGDILLRLSKYQIDFGAFAVICFFIISGFLITQSLYNSRNYLDYAIKRVLRIFPALITSTVLFAVILGSFVSKMTFSEYYNTDNQNSVLSFVIDSITLNVSGFHSTTNDLFSTNPFPGAINGSAWTLKHEFACYIIIAIMAFFYIFRHKALLLITSFVTLCLVLLNLTTGYKITQSTFWVMIEYQFFFKFLFYFLAGSLLFVFKDKVLINGRFTLLAFLILLISTKLGILQYAMLLCLPYLVISISTKIRFSAFRKYGDFSYGMYIYAFPVQQMVMYLLGGNLNLLSFFIISFFGTLVLSILSWKYIEEPALKLKRSLKITFSKNKTTASH